MTLTQGVTDCHSLADYSTVRNFYSLMRHRSHVTCPCATRHSTRHNTTWRDQSIDTPHAVIHHHHQRLLSSTSTFLSRSQSKSVVRSVRSVHEYSSSAIRFEPDHLVCSDARMSDALILSYSRLLCLVPPSVPCGEDVVHAWSGHLSPSTGVSVLGVVTPVPCLAPSRDIPPVILCVSDLVMLRGLVRVCYVSYLTYQGRNAMLRVWYGNISCMVCTCHVLWYVSRTLLVCCWYIGCYVDGASLLHDSIYVPCTYQIRTNMFRVWYVHGSYITRVSCDIVNVFCCDWYMIITCIIR
jgi:hypothetical protein